MSNVARGFSSTRDSGTNVARSGIGTLTVSGNLNSTNCNVFARLNKALPQSNDLVSVSGALAFNGTIGTVTVTNIGATAVAVGDTFKLFSKALTGGNTLTVTGA